jgi:hypothetical protein
MPAGLARLPNRPDNNIIGLTSIPTDGKISGERLAPAPSADSILKGDNLWKRLFRNKSAKKNPASSTKSK